MIDLCDGADQADFIHVTPSHIGLPKDADLIVVDDTPGIGPCRSDPEQHRQLRRSYWLAEEEIFSPRRRRLRKKDRSDFLRTFTGWSPSAKTLFHTRGFAEALNHFSSKRRVILWTTRDWTDRLVLWWLLDAIDRSHIDRSRFSIAQASSPDAPTDSRQPNPDRLACIPARNLRIAFDNRRLLSRKTLSEGARLWRKFCRASPKVFDAARRRGSEVFPDLTAIAEWHGLWFPRRDTRSAKIRLSEFDEIILEGFSSEEWRTPLDVHHASYYAGTVLKSDSNAQTRTAESLSDELARYRKYKHDDQRLCRMIDERVSHQQHDRLQPITIEFGIQLFARRLHEWELHNRDDPAVTSTAGPNQVNHLSWVCYRLTAKGKRLLEEGLLLSNNAPPFYVGGCTVHSPTEIWVRQICGDKWSLERAEADAF